MGLSKIDKDLGNNQCAPSKSQRTVASTLK